MKKIIWGFFLIAFAFITANAQGNWVVDKDHSKISFSVKHMVISDVSGKFSDYTIAITGDALRLEQASLKATIRVNSISTDNEKRDAHLKSADFFDAAHYPEIIFVSKTIKKSGPHTYAITGDLTMKGITKPVTFAAKMNGQIKDPWGNERMGWTVETTVNRFDFGLKWNKLLESGGLVVGDKVTITMHVELIKK